MVGLTSRVVRMQPATSTLTRLTLKVREAVKLVGSGSIFLRARRGKSFPWMRGRVEGLGCTAWVEPKVG